MPSAHHALVALLLLATVGAGVAVQPAMAATQPAGTTASLAQASDDTITQTQRYALVPDETGEVAVTLSYAIPDRVTGLATQIPADAAVTDTDGFDRVNDTHFEWDERTATATIDLRYDPNQTTDRTGLEAAPGRYLFADAGSWALVSRLRTPTEWRYTGSGDDPVTFERRLATAGPGYAGDQMVYLGEVRTLDRTTGGQTIRLVVPEQAALAEPPGTILDSLATASRSLQVGDRDAVVTAFAAPTGSVDWGVRGLELGGAEFWVRDSEPLDIPSNVWLHEYVHTRQAFAPTERTQWLTEGTAVYYAALLALEQGHIDFEQFRGLLAKGEQPRYDEVVLADRATWTANAQYVKGPLVAGRIDETIRRETGTTSFEGTMARLNRADGQVTEDRLLGAVEATGGATARDAATRYTTTTAPVSAWNETTQRRLFGPLPAAVSYRLPANATGYRVGGPYRNGTVGSTPVRLATGETLTVESVVENTGDEAGQYNATLTIDGSAASSATGDIAATSERVVPLSHHFDTPGEYAVGVGEDSVPVVVEPPAEPTVTALRVDSQSVPPNGEVAVTATVSNDAAVPADGTVAFTRNGTVVERRPVTLAPGASETLSVRIAMPAAGEVSVGAGAADPVTVTVRQSSGSAGPGFTAHTVLLAALLAAVAALVRRR